LTLHYQKDAFKKLSTFAIATEWQAELQSCKRQTTHNFVVCEQLYAARDSAQHAMADIKSELDQARADMQLEWDALTLIISAEDDNGTPQVSGAALAALFGGNAPQDAKRDTALKAGDSPGPTGSRRSMRLRGKHALGKPKKSKDEKYAAMRAQWDEITTAMQMEDEAEIVQFFNAAEDQVGWPPQYLFR
jgi:hypothetical protein